MISGSALHSSKPEILASPRSWGSFFNLEINCQQKALHLNCRPHLDVDTHALYFFLEPKQLLMTQQPGYFAINMSKDTYLCFLAHTKIKHLSWLPLVMIWALS